MNYNVTKNRLEKAQILHIVRNSFGKNTEVNGYTEFAMMSCEQGMMQTEVKAA